MRSSKTRQMTLISLMTALICVSSYISVPIPPVPVTAQTLTILLAGLLLSPLAAGTSVGLFVMLGAIGVPVFSGGRAGLEVLAGPSGGYLIGFIACAIVVSLLKGNGKDFKRNLIACVIGGFGVIYVIALPWLSYVLNMGLEATLAAGLYKFIIGDALKIVLAAYLGVRLNDALGERV